MTSFAVIKELIKNGNTIELTVKGNSMRPFLADGTDKVIAKKPTKPITIGDIAFFEDKYGRTIMHRVCKITDEGYYFCGDGMTTAEGPVPKENIFAVVEAVIINGKKYSVKSPFAQFFTIRAKFKRIKYK